MLGLSDSVVTLGKVIHDHIAKLSSRQLAKNAADDQWNTSADTNCTAFEVIHRGLDLGHRQGREDVDKSPTPGIEPKGQTDGRIFEHVERRDEVLKSEAPLWDHVAFEVKQEFPIRPFVCALS